MKKQDIYKAIKSICLLINICIGLVLIFGFFVGIPKPVIIVLIPLCIINLVVGLKLNNS